MKNIQLTAFLILSKNTVTEALKKIDANEKGILFVVDENNKLMGTLTDGDVRRWLIKRGELSGVVESIMNKNPKSISKEEVIRGNEIMSQYGITALPVIDSNGYIIDIVFKEAVGIKSKKIGDTLRNVPVVIMAGGKGTRLYPYTKILPKPLIPIGDIPIIERIINRFQDFGVNSFYVTVNYKKSMIKSYFGEIGIDGKINYIEENKPLGTAGSLSLIKNRFSQPFIVTNCDILIRADYEDIYRYHKESGNELTIVTALKNIMVPYGVIYSGENGIISSMEEKPKNSYFINTGMYILNSELVNDIPEDEFFHMTDLANKLLKEGRKIGMYPVGEDSFLDMGEFEEMHRMEEKLNLKSE